MEGAILGIKSPLGGFLFCDAYFRTLVLLFCVVWLHNPDPDCDYIYPR